jgi:hypothetical protein
MDYRFIVELSPEAYDEMLARMASERKLLFPASVFCVCRMQEPASAGPGFHAEQSQRRTFAKNSNVGVVVQPPSVTPEHLDL